MSQVFADNLLPSTTGYDLGSVTQQWDVFSQNITCSGTASFTGTLAITKLEDIRFADQFSGASVTAKIDTALADTATLLVLVPSSMGAGNATAIASGKSILDLRAGFPKIFTNYSVSSPAFQVNDAGAAISPAFTSITANPASAGQLRLASADTIKFRNNANGADILGLSKDSSDVVQLGDTAGGKINGALAIAGALSGVTTLAASGVITSTLATGTAPFTIASTTVVSNLNVATLNGVTVSGAAANGQVLQASSASAASWVTLTSSATGWTYNATKKRWELFDSTIATWLQDVRPGYALYCDFSVAAYDSTTFLIESGGMEWVYVANAIAATSPAIRISTSNVANNVAGMSGRSGQGIDAANLQCFWFVLDPVQSDANTTQRCGLGVDNTSDPPANGIYLERLGADASWFLVTRAAGVETRNTTSIAHAIGKVGFIVVKNGTTNVKAYQAGSATALATNSANIPADGTILNPFQQVKTLAAAVKSLDTYLFRATGVSVIAGY